MDCVVLYVSCVGRLQLDHVTMKLQSVLNGRENDINARKAAIHKKLAKHVNKACNARWKGDDLQ